MSNLRRVILGEDFNDSSADEDQSAGVMKFMASEFHRRKMQRDNQPTMHVGSISGWRYIHRDRVSGNKRLIKDYFAENPVYPANIFRRHFRMNRPLFLRILNAIEQYDDYFIQKIDAVGFPGLSGLQKMTAAIRMLAYGMPVDAVDEYVRIGESTTIESLKRFCVGIISIYGEEYLRLPTEADISRLL
ncbi:uncharacterized protein LOC132306534 [Cornus florida]|uniref:uncharacterized protein LOC132306534 n=1 Tax=Cornus florida TaxID=4283 RepID=UPI0028995C1C|nr:uncharacterized protein LOC132306534 [Cornus florida]